MKQIIFCFFSLLIIILIIELTNASQLSISPAELFINGTLEAENCQEIKITNDYAGNLIGDIKWARTQSREVKDYNLNGYYFEIATKYPKHIYFGEKDRRSYKICFSTKKEGEYNGLLIYRTEKGYAGIGIWIHLTINKVKINKSMIILTLTPTFYLFIILILLKVNNRQKNYHSDLDF